MEKNSHVTYKDILARLSEQNIHYEILESDDGGRFIVIARGGRIFGPFFNENSEDILWTNGVWKSQDEFECFLKGQNSWNLGGDRIWPAPEFPFFTKERNCFNDTYIVQKGIDPASYTVHRDSYGNVKVDGILNGELYESKYREKSIRMSRTVYPSGNPLRYLSKATMYLNDVRFAGYEQEIAAENLKPGDEMELEVWNLTQINPDGVLSIPYYGDFEYIDQYEPTGSDIIKIDDTHSELHIDSKDDHKISIRAAGITGRASYLNRLDGDEWYLFVKNYMNDPGADYVSEAWKTQGRNGSSLHIYIDGGEKGGFAEFENSGVPFGGKTGRQRTLDRIGQWFFFGSREKMVEIRKVLTGV